VSDLKALSNLKELVNLGISDNLVTDVSPLENLTKLRYLILWRNKIKDIGVLSNMPEMTDLSIGDNPIESIEPLRIMIKMRELKMDNALIADLSPLAGMNDLSILKIGGNRITDLRSLKALANISILDANPNPIFNNDKVGFLEICPADAASTAVRNLCKK
jgi:internalin A